MDDYVLALRDAEVTRYHFMAQVAARDEAGQWASAGVVVGPAVADLGCGPGAVSAVLAEVVDDVHTDVRRHRTHSHLIVEQGPREVVQGT